MSLGRGYKKMFSKTEDYIIESIPKSVGWLKKRKWIKYKTSLMKSEKVLVWFHKSIVLWAYLKKEEEYWLPYEKAIFFMDIFEENNKNPKIFMEEENGIVRFYGVVDKLLIVFTRNFEEVLKTVKKYSNANIKFLSIGNSGKKFHKSLKKNEIAQKINFEKQEDFYSFEESTLVELNEDKDFFDQEYDIVNSKNSEEYGIDELFYFWFDGKKNKKLKHKKYLSMLLFCSSIIFSLFAVFFSYKEKELEYYIDSKFASLSKPNELDDDLNEHLDEIEKLENLL